MKEDVISNASGKATIILIVDDEPDITTTYSMLFECHGFRVSTASNGKSALDMIDTVAPDVILSDYMMPLVNGGELCTTLKRDARWKAIPFILQSAAFPTKDVRPPCDLLLQKPVPFDALLKEINRLLDKC